MKRATKAAENPYCIARLAAAETNDDLNSREGAAVATGIERTRLARIELGTVVPYPDDVRMMADVYNAPDLMNWHCTHDCPIGQCTIPMAELTSVEGLAVRACLALRSAEDIKNTLLDVSADGVISEDERPKLQQIMRQLTEITRVAMQAQQYAAKLGIEVSP